MTGEQQNLGSEPCILTSLGVLVPLITVLLKPLCVQPTLRKPEVKGPESITRPDRSGGGGTVSNKNGRPRKSRETNPGQEGVKGGLQSVL